MQEGNTKDLYLGIDGGGSSCRARLRDRDGQLLGSGEAGPANLRLGIDTATAAILSCTRQALQRAGLSDTPLHKLHAGMGLAGAVLLEDKQSTLSLQQKFASCSLNQDAYIACLGAHLGQPGGVVIVGTGSCAQIISPAQSRTYGGWGFALSDQASGAWLGRSALVYALQALDGTRTSSSLSDAIGAHFELAAAQLLRWSDTATPAHYASFAPLVFQHADAGDAVALALIEHACAELERLVDTLAKHRTGRISLVGGLAANYLRYLPDSAQQQLRRVEADALDGALILAGLPLSALSQGL